MSLRVIEDKRERMNQLTCPRRNGRYFPVRSAHSVVKGRITFSIQLNCSAKESICVFLFDLIHS
jgi:hypothetical protein